MAEEVGYFNVPQANRVWKATLAVERSLGGTSGDSLAMERGYTPAPAYFRNDSGFTVPAYGCVQIIGIYDETGGQNYLTVKRPMQRTASILGGWAFNGPREVVDKDFGVLQAGPIFRAIKDSTTMSIGMRLGPIDSQFKLGKGCVFSYAGTDNVETDCIRVVRCETPIHATAGSSGIAGNSSATVTSRYFDGTQWQSGSITYTAYNSTTTSIAANSKLILFPVDGVWSAMEMCA